MYTEQRERIKCNGHYKVLRKFSCNIVYTGFYNRHISRTSSVSSVYKLIKYELVEGAVVKLRKDTDFM